MSEQDAVRNCTHSTKEVEVEGTTYTIRKVSPLAFLASGSIPMGAPKAVEGKGSVRPDTETIIRDRLTAERDRLLESEALDMVGIRRIDEIEAELGRRESARLKRETSSLVAILTEGLVSPQFESLNQFSVEACNTLVTAIMSFSGLSSGAAEQLDRFSKKPAASNHSG